MNANEPLIQMEGVTKVFVTDEVETHALAGIHMDSARRVRVDFRPVRLRQIDAAGDSRPAGHADAMASLRLNGRPVQDLKM